MSSWAIDEGVGADAPLIETSDLYLVGIHCGCQPMAPADFGGEKAARETLSLHVGSSLSPALPLRLSPLPLPPDPEPKGWSTVEATVAAAAAAAAVVAALVLGGQVQSWMQLPHGIIFCLF